ncbi:MAG: M3 family oligoendopeptidase [Sedimentisphaerales bacterium]|nr:M3 family oligoendopeptidase [Sedimentisphaerales bacterium]
MKSTILTSLSICLLFTVVGCGLNTTEKQLDGFIDKHVAKTDPLTREKNLAFWQAMTTGSKDAYQQLSQLELQISKIYSNADDFEFLKQTKASGQISDRQLARQLDLLYLRYLPNQIEPGLLEKLVELNTKVTETYNTYRGSIDGREVTQTEIYEIMTGSKDSVLREKAWRASKEVGNKVIAELIQLVKLRNQAAKSVGYESYHTMILATTEQDVKVLDKIFAELDELTREPYAELKAELDKILAADYAIAPGQMQPWHYHDPFFQRGPLVYDCDFDAYYKNVDIRELSEKYYAGIGLPVDDILARSDLYDRPGKDPHAFSEDIDRHGDVRVLCNLDNTERWMETILHELGHSVYSKYHNADAPYLLREPAHSFTTEAVAMFFGRLSRNAAWMKPMLNLSDEEAVRVQAVAARYLRDQEIIFSRWAMVMYHFEKQLYANPDQDLNNLWWQLVEKYQMIKRPPGAIDAGWASKLHFTFAPCYYHNYMLGELFASQLHYKIAQKVLHRPPNQNISFIGEPRIGSYLRENVFGPGAIYSWNQMITRATGEPLTARFFAAQFVD